MIELLRPSLMNSAWTCTLDSYINCETYRMEYRIESPIERNIIQIYRNKLREKMNMPEWRSVPIAWEKLQSMWIIKSRNKIESPQKKVENMVVVYKEEWIVTKHAACVIWKADFHRILAWWNGRVFLPKKGKYEFFSYEK